MEWSQLSDNDRNTLRALLNLDENGLSSSNGSSTPHPTTATANDQVVAAETTTTTSAIVSGVREEFLHAIPYLSAILALKKEQRAQGNLTPKLLEDKLAVTVKSCYPALKFVDFLVVWIEAAVEFELRPRKQLPSSSLPPPPAVMAESEPDSIGENKKRPRCDDDEEEKKEQRTAVPAETTTKRFVFESLHFVHKDSSKHPQKGSFELQSVLRKGFPTDTQCVAGIAMHFALSAYATIQAHRFKESNAPNSAAVSASSLPSLVVPKSVAVFGMGGNVTANCLIHALPSTVLHVVEAEPVTYAACLQHGAIASNPNMNVYIKDVLELVKEDKTQCAFPSDLDMLFLDCFDPLVGTMIHPENLLQDIKSKWMSTTTRGSRTSTLSLLVVNVHRVANKETLLPFVNVFGSRSVHAVAVPNCAQCMVICCCDTESNNGDDDDSTGSPAASATIRDKQTNPFDFTLTDLRSEQLALNSSGVFKAGFALHTEVTKSALLTVKAAKKNSDEKPVVARVWSQ